MQRPRLSAVEPVQQQTPQAQFTGLCDCLKQPRRVRPTPSRPDDGSDFVEIRPRRRIRVLHLLPVKRPKGQPVIQQPEPPPPKSAFASSIFIDSRTYPFGQDYDYDPNRNYDHFLAVRADVEANLDSAEESCQPGMPDYSDDYVPVDLTVNGNREEEEIPDCDPEDEDLSDYDDFPTAAQPPLPVYGFESPYHPKNVAETAERCLTVVRIYADRLVHVILDEAFLEYGALRELVALPHRRHGSSCRRRWKSDESDGREPYDVDGYIVPCECRQVNGSPPRHDHDLELTCGRCCPRSTGWLEPAVTLNGWSEPPTIRQHRDQVFYYDNPTFRSSLLGLDGSNVRGESYLDQAQRAASFRMTRSRSSARLRSAGLPNGQRNVVGLDETDPPDPMSKFTYHPTGDDGRLDDGSSSSFPSSTWGSSTDSSVRYVRRFLSRKFKTKPLLFFVHGVGDSADLWRSQLAFFHERGYETLAMDLVGHGLSCAPDDPKAYTFHYILTDVIALFDRYSKERNVVIGHSYGACFAAALARHRPKLVSHLILLSGGGPFPLCPQPAKVHLPLCLTSCVRSLLSCGTRRETFYVPSRKQARVVKNLDIPSYVLKYIRQGQVWLEGDASYHKHIVVPTLLIYGLRDPYVTLVEECEMEKTIPRAFLELIPEASHMIMLDAPNQVNDMIYKFLRRWDR